MTYTKQILNLVILGLSFLVVGCETQKVHLDETTNKNVKELNPQTIIFVGPKGELTFTDSEGNIVKPCNSQCKIFTEKGMVNFIGSVAITSSILNPTCVYTYTIDGVTTEIEYEC